MAIYIKTEDGAESLSNEYDSPKAVNVSTAGTAVGSSTNPIYINSSGIATASSSSIGGTGNPAYLNNGIITACTYPVSGSWFQGVPNLSSAGVMEVGRYFDFHYASANTADYDCRLQVQGANSNNVYLPTVSGELVTHTTGSAVGGTAKPVYISSTGVATACSSTVGNSYTPVYLNSGTITACSYTQPISVHVPSSTPNLNLSFDVSSVSAFIVFIFWTNGLVYVKVTVSSLTTSLSSDPITSYAIYGSLPTTLLAILDSSTTARLKIKFGTSTYSCCILSTYYDIFKSYSLAAS